LPGFWGKTGNNLVADKSPTEGRKSNKMSTKYFAVNVYKQTDNRFSIETFDHVLMVANDDDIKELSTIGRAFDDAPEFTHFGPFGKFCLNSYSDEGNPNIREAKATRVMVSEKLSDGELLSHLLKSARDKAKYDAICEARYKAHRAEQMKQSIKESQERECKEAERIAKLTTIEWQDDGTAIHDLYDAINVISRLEFDHRWKSWVKEITGVDREASNGYMYTGQFLQDGTVEITKGERRLFLVAAESGSRKYRTCYYTVVELTEEGTLKKHDIDDNDDKRGWALRMRNDIEALLNS
jgi:hypothetical protein